LDKKSNFQKNGKKLIFRFWCCDNLSNDKLPNAKLPNAKLPNAKLLNVIGTTDSTASLVVSASP